MDSSIVALIAAGALLGGAAAWKGALAVGPEPTVLTITLREPRPCSGRLTIEYAFTSVLARMSSSAWIEIEIPGLREAASRTSI